MLSPNQIVQRWFDEIWNQGRAETIDELLAPDGVVNGLPGGPLRGPEQFRAFHAQLNQRFSDFDILVNDSAEWGNQAMVRFNLIMTYTPSGHRAALESACWVRCENGQVTQACNYIDFLALLAQLSLAPADYFQKQISS